MSDSNMMMNLASINGTGNNASSSGSKSKTGLEIDDFYKLMAAQLQNQDMSSPMDQSAFLNQMVQMAVVQAIDTFTNISVNSYAASLVGKDVTVAEIGKDNAINEIYGKVTGTGLYSGEQILFIDGKSYRMSQIMAIGKLPEKEETTDSDDKENGSDIDPVENDND